MRTPGIALGPGSLVVLLVSELKTFANTGNLKQFHCDTFKCLRNALILVVIMPKGAATRMSQMPVTSFPMSIRIVKTMPRQITAPVNMLVTGIENPIEA